jgi:hypothetical protein
MKRVLLALLALCAVSTASATHEDTLKLVSNGGTTSLQLRWEGGVGVFSCVGTFNAATVALQYRGPDDSTFLPVVSSAGTAASLTAAGSATFYLHRTIVQVAITGGTPAGLYCSVGAVLNGN